MKFLQISDTHLGYRQYGLIEREEDFFDVFEEAIEIAIKENVDFILHSGDFFHTSRPSNQTFLKAIEVIKRLKDHKIPIFTISGNHDRGNQIRDISPLKILESFGLKLIDAGSIEHEGVVISGLKYIPKVALRQSKLKNFLEKIRENSPNNNAIHLLMLHHEFQPFFPNSILNLHEELPDGYNYVGIGHYHIPQEPFYIRDSFILYSGSTEYTAYNPKEEEIDKKIHLIEFSDGKFSYQPLTLSRKRPFLRFTLSENSLEEDIKTLKYEIEKMQTQYSKKPVLILKGKLREKSLKDVDYLLSKEDIKELTIYINYSIESSQVLDVSSIPTSPEEIIDIEKELKKLIEDETLYEKAIEILSTFKNLEIDEAKKILKENPDILKF